MARRLCSALLVLCACTGGGEKTTRVFLNVVWDEASAVDQLRVRVDREGNVAAGPAFRPNAPALEPLAAAQSMRLIVPDDLSGSEVDVVVEGLAAGKVISRGSARVVLAAKKEVSMQMTLGTSAPSCLACEGCCQGELCVAADAERCGANGEACTSCGARADSCVEGKCGCGSAPACMKGQRCVAGACRCDGSSCPGGCCDKDICTARSLAHCGAGGAQCSRCDAVVADSCSVEGTCQCGLGEPCQNGKHCSGGVCVCDGTSCPGGCCDSAGACQNGSDPLMCGAGGGACERCPTNMDGSQQGCVLGVCSGCAVSCTDGCCSGSTCHAAAPETCGEGGGACRRCDLARADTCDAAGVCTCGEQAQCAIGQSCVSGECLCDLGSCPNGCCTARIGGECLPGRNEAACGRDGNLCEPCAAPGVCNTQTGICEGSACDTKNCQGARCCKGDTCREQGRTDKDETPEGVFCGVGAAACTFCELNKADGCSSDGTCSCGAQAACANGQRCSKGRCQCDAQTCPNGCCEDGVCHAPPSVDACGFAAEACVSCKKNGGNRCSRQGECRCGRNPACGPGLRCVGNGDESRCVCDERSGCAGCCENQDTCRTEDDAARCGSGGAACAACGAEQECRDHACRCTRDSCPGCCDGEECRMDDRDAAHCGSGGKICFGCGQNQACNASGQCICADIQCSLSGICCPSGQSCFSGLVCGISSQAL